MEFNNFKKILNYLHQPVDHIEQDQIIPITNFFIQISKEYRKDLQQHDLQSQQGRVCAITWMLNNFFEEHHGQFINVQSTKQSLGVNNIGYPFVELGLGEVMKSTIQAMNSFDIPNSAFNLGYSSLRKENTENIDSNVTHELPHLINLFHTNGLEVFNMLFKYGTSLFKKKYNIGYWPWELPLWPASLSKNLLFMDELWAMSKFNYDCYKEATSIPVYHMPPTVKAPTPSIKGREDFGIPKEKFAFFFSFDINSSPLRKNPWAVIEAFNKAFSLDNDEVCLVVKVIADDKNLPEFKKLLKVAQRDSRLVLITKTLSSPDNAALMSNIDAFVSLHRSEGFGLLIAEAMMFEKPVITTNFSGNLDFCNQENCLLVDSKIVHLKENDYPYASPEQFWADPNRDTASKHMKNLLTNPSLYKSLQKPGKEYLKTHHSIEACGFRYQERIHEIYKNYN